MSIPESIRTKLRELGLFYTILGVISSLITIGSFMAWLFDRLPEDPLTTLLIAAAIFNTLVTLVFINWAIAKKNKFNKAKPEVGTKKSSYVSQGWQNPTKQNHAETEEVDKWVNLCEKLTKRVGECNEERNTQSIFSKTTLSEEDIARIRSQATGMFETSVPLKKPNDPLYNEAKEKLNEYEAKKRT